MPTGIYKLKDGTLVPGTTTIMGAFKDSGGLVHWAWEQVFTIQPSVTFLTECMKFQKMKLFYEHSTSLKIGGINNNLKWCGPKGKWFQNDTNMVAALICM